jgi:hypothetical protein
VVRRIANQHHPSIKLDTPKKLDIHRWSARDCEHGCLESHPFLDWSTKEVMYWTMHGRTVNKAASKPIP